MDAQYLPPLHEVLDRLPWFRELTDDHRDAMVREVARKLVRETSREEFTDLLLRWCEVAEDDSKWGRLRELQKRGILRPPAA